MQALAGTWELEIPEKWATRAKGFVVLDHDGTFRLVAIGEVAGAPVQVDLIGSWQLQGQTITVKFTQSLDLPKAVGQGGSLRIVSFDSSRLVLQDEDAESEALHRSHLPASLPPELNGPMILLTGPSELTSSAPPPPFPSEAAQRDLRGHGVFRLHTDLRDGVVRKVEIERSTGNPILDKAAVTAFAKWYFKAPLLRQIQRRRDPSNTSGEIVFRVPWSFVHSPPTKFITW
jgi:TonB family protein